ncbi:MAG: hypothetical protein KJ622_17225 [Alphaproteobacteria bacterium]|nr:hypothetical protein [Alphaproteobacteria bacterium]
MNFKPRIAFKSLAVAAALFAVWASNGPVSAEDAKPAPAAQPSLADNISKIAEMWAQMGKKWAEATPKMMEDINASCVSCHAQKDTYYAEWAQKMTDLMNASAAAADAHAKAYSK